MKEVTSQISLIDFEQIAHKEAEFLKSEQIRLEYEE